MEYSEVWLNFCDLYFNQAFMTLWGTIDIAMQDFVSSYDSSTVMEVEKVLNYLLSSDMSDAELEDIWLNSHGEVAVFDTENPSLRTFFREILTSIESAKTNK